MLNSSYKVNRDLLTKMSSIRNTDGGLVVQRNYTYDKLGRPVTRQTLRSGGAMNETFDDNDRSESPRGLGVGLDKSAAFAPKGENCRRLEGRLAKSDRFCPKGVRSRRGDSEASVDGAMPSQDARRPRTGRTRSGRAGRLDKSAAFAPKGRGVDGATPSQSVQWSREYHDAETGLVYYNYRYYNPLDGRWTKRDPVFGDSQYVYCKNCMTRLIDVDGLIPTNTIDGAMEEAIMSGNIRLLEELLGLAGSTLSAQRARKAAKALAKLKAEKARYGNCTKEQHHQLHSQVGEKCKRPKFSCKNCDDCKIIRENIGKASECIEARKAINNICFNGGDAAHIAQVVKTEAAMANCKNLAKQLNCQ